MRCESKILKVMNACVMCKDEKIFSRKPHYPRPFSKCASELATVVVKKDVVDEDWIREIHRVSHGGVVEIGSVIQTRLSVRLCFYRCL